MIFPLIWRLLPGPVAVRIAVLLAIVLALVWVAFTVVFPWIATDILPPPDGSVDVPSPSGTPSPTGTRLPTGTTSPTSPAAR